MTEKDIEELIELIPRLGGCDFAITSQEDEDYNCVAWAFGDKNRFWWPINDPDYYWPQDLPLEESSQVIGQAFEIAGFSPCQNYDLEVGIEKIAIYETTSGPKHVARQLPSGQWTSKLGSGHDIRHSTADALCGSRYGEIVTVMSRQRPD